MLVLTRLSIAAALVAGVVASANALMIDDFSTGPDNLLIQNGTGLLAQSETGTSILGGQRDSILAVTSSPFLQQTSLQITGDNGSMPGAFYSSGIGDMGNVNFNYSGLHIQGTQGPGLNANVSGDGAFDIGVLASDTALTFTVTLTTYGMGGVDEVSTGTMTTSGPVTTPTTFSMNFSDMNVGAGSTMGFDSSNLSKVSVQVAPANAGGDFALASFSTAPVPEPASLAAVVIGVAGLLRRRKSRRV